MKKEKNLYICTRRNNRLHTENGISEVNKIKDIPSWFEPRWDHTAKRLISRAFVILTPCPLLLICIFVAIKDKLAAIFQIHTDKTMKKFFIYTFIIIISIFQNSCNGQNNTAKEVYNQDFKWKITVPTGFEEVSAKDWEKQQQKGADAIENTSGEEVINQAKIIFVFKNGQFNYFESNYQPFDESFNGNYIESFDAVNDIIYETFISQMPGTKVEKQRGTELIDNLEFQFCKMKIIYPNNMIFYMEMYSRLFDKREFSVNIMYMEKEKGEAMKQSLLNSKFKK